jgi:hypothetical protein
VSTEGLATCGLCTGKVFHELSKTGIRTNEMSMIFEMTAVRWSIRSSSGRHCSFTEVLHAASLVYSAITLLLPVIKYSMMEDIIDEIWNAFGDTYGDSIWVKEIKEVR